jgi:hypothetical protein
MPLRYNPPIVVPAEAGTHLSAARTVEGWVPTFVGTTQLSGASR